MFTFTLREPCKKMTLRVELTGEERITEIKRIAIEYWREDGLVLRKGFLILNDEEKVSDVILKDDTIDVLSFGTT